MCKPGLIQSCYSGPDATKGKGACKSGQQTCNTDGIGFSDCLGEVLPMAMDDCAAKVDATCDELLGCPCMPKSVDDCTTPLSGLCTTGTRVCLGTGEGYDVCVPLVKPAFDDCFSPADEDCDGTPITCTGGSIFAAASGATGDESVFAVASDAAGNIFLGGVSGANEGIDYFLHTGTADVTKLDKSGTQAWKKSFTTIGSGSYSVVRGVTVDKVGDVIVVGQYLGAMSVNGVALTSAPNGTDVFVIKLDTTGATKWSQSFFGTGDQAGMGISAAADGNVFIIGTMDGTMALGNAILSSVGGDDVFVVKLDGATGTPTWGKNFGDANSQFGWDVVATPDGNVAVTGQFEGNINFGQGNLGNGGGADMYLAKLDGNNGTQLWAKRFGENDDQVGYGIAADSNGNIVLTGSVEGKTDFGGGPFDIGAGKPPDAFVARFAPDGTYKWSKLYGDSSNNQLGRDVAVDAAGNILVTGHFTGTLQIGSTVLVNPMGNGGAWDVFVAKLKAVDGSLGWARKFGDTSTQLPRAITVDPLGNVIFGGIFSGTIDFPPPAGLSFTSMNGTYDAFWAKLAP